MATRIVIKRRIEEDKERLKLYLAQEKKILEGGVQAYGIGSRNLQRYNTDLRAIRDAIDELREEIDDLEAQLGGYGRRATRAVVIRDW